MNNTIEIVGLIAALLTTIAFLPQVVKTWKTKDVEGLSLSMYTIFLTGVLLWLAYGIMIGSLPVIIANALTALSGAFLVFCKVRYRKQEVV